MADHTNEYIISQVLLNGNTYDIHDKAAIHDIADLGLGGNPLVFKGTVATVDALNAVANPVAGWVYLVTADQSEWVYDGTKWELMDSAMVGEHTHDVVVPTKATTVDASKVVSAGSVTAGSDVVFTAGSHTADSFEQGTDTWKANTPTVIDTDEFNGGSFTQGTDSFSANVPTKIDTTKFIGGSASLVGGSYTKQALSYTAPSFSNGFYTPGTDDTFTAGSASLTASSASLKDAENPSWGASVDANGVLSFSWDAGSHGSVNYVAPTLNYTAPTFTQGDHTKIDMSKFNAGSASISDGGVSFPTVSYTAPSFGAGFYTEGSAASFTQGKDNFTPASLGDGFYTAGSAAEFSQGTDKFTSGTYTAPTLTGGKATVVALPTFSTVSNLWSGNGSVTVTSGDPEAAE